MLGTMQSRPGRPLLDCRLIARENWISLGTFTIAATIMDLKIESSQLRRQPDPLLRCAVSLALEVAWSVLFEVAVGILKMVWTGQMM